jgi:hypothetical protein
MSSARNRSGVGTSGAVRSSAASRRSKSPDLLQSEQPGLRRIVQQRLLKDVFESTSGTFGNGDRWLSLVTLFFQDV